jgi:hypothetical protein
MYDDGEDEDKTAQEDSANSVRSAPATNTDPVFPDQNLNTDGVQTEQTREVAENTPAGRNLGPRVAATDPGDVLTYSLDTGNDAASFDINRATGQLTTKAALDYEDADIRESTVTVTATDPFGATVTSVVTITVTDVNEDPTVMGAASIDHAENGTELDIDAEASGVQDAIYTASDEDDADNAATGLTWLLSGADASKFDITTTGATRTLSFKANPDYESPGDSSEIVGATDGAGALMSSYTPTTGDVGSVLRATAMYDDGEDEDKTAQEDSAHAVRQAPESNGSGGEHACGHEYRRSRCSQ